jgi:hypothetical protein
LTRKYGPSLSLTYPNEMLVSHPMLVVSSAYVSALVRIGGSVESARSLSGPSAVPSHAARARIPAT